jgi:hypothetical protein
MKLDGLRKIIKEELAKTINENTPKYKEGDTFLHVGTKYTVISDDGYSIKAKDKSGKVKKFNYNMLKETVILSKADQGGRTAMRAIDNLVKQYNGLPLQDIVDSTLADNNVNTTGDLSLEDIYDLNAKIIGAIQSAQTEPEKVDKELEAAAKKAFLNKERAAGRTSGLD